MSASPGPGTPGPQSGQWTSQPETEMVPTPTCAGSTARRAPEEVGSTMHVQMFTISVNILGIVRDVISEERAIHVFSKIVEEECIRVSDTY